MLFHINHRLSDDRLLRTPPLGLTGCEKQIHDISDQIDPSSSIFSNLIQPTDRTEIPVENNILLQYCLNVQNPSCQTNCESINDSKGQYDSSLLCEIKSSTENVNSQLSSDNNDEIPFNAKQWIIRDVALCKGRPPRLWEFLRLLLDNECYTSYASWLNKTDGFFKIHKPDQVANLWLKVKKRRTSSSSSYAIFSRSIRYYYKSGIMIKTRRPYTYHFR